jgi:hypothetical protein
MIDWINKNKLSVAFIGGAIVIGSQWATCTIEPNLVNGDNKEDAIQEIQQEAEGSSSDSAAQN